MSDMVETVEIVTTVTRFRIRAAKVEVTDAEGREVLRQLVVGGRLVSSRDNGVVTPHPNMPEYTRDMFPADFDTWTREGRIVRSVWSSGSYKIRCYVRFGRVRPRFDQVGDASASTYLFTAFSREDVRAFLVSEREKYKGGSVCSRSV